MPLVLQKSALCALLWTAAACTFITDANERTVSGRAEGDLRFTFKSMAVHESVPMDVAIVNQEQLLQGRARILLPPKPPGKDYPEVELLMEKTLGDGSYQLFFYIDDDADNEIDLKREGDGSTSVLEHIWREPVPARGAGSFTHNIRFMQFTQQDITSIGGDVVLEGPAIPAAVAEAVKLCLAQRFNAAMRKNLQVKVFLAEDGRQIGHFETFRGNPVPSSVRLGGIVDAPNAYRFDVFVDGEKKSSFNRDSEIGQDLVVPAGEWFPITLAEITACLRPGS